MLRSLERQGNFFPFHPVDKHRLCQSGNFSPSGFSAKINPVCASQAGGDIPRAAGQFKVKWFQGI
jgi:hypothetical protein